MKTLTFDERTQVKINDLNKEQHELLFKISEVREDVAYWRAMVSLGSHERLVHQQHEVISKSQTMLDGKRGDLQKLVNQFASNQEKLKENNDRLAGRQVKPAPTPT